MSGPKQQNSTRPNTNNQRQEENRQKTTRQIPSGATPKNPAELIKVKIGDDEKTLKEILKENRNSSSPSQISKISVDGSQSQILDDKILKQLTIHGLLEKSLEISGFIIEGPLKFPPDLDITFTNCEFKKNNTINFNGQNLTINECKILEGTILRSNDPTAKINIENTTFPDKNNPKNDGLLEPLTEATERAFIIDGFAEELTIKNSTGLIILSNLTLEDKNNAPQKVKFLDDSEQEITNLENITNKYRVIIPKRNLNDDIFQQFKKKKNNIDTFIEEKKSLIDEYINLHAKIKEREEHLAELEERNKQKLLNKLIGLGNRLIFRKKQVTVTEDKILNELKEQEKKLKEKLLELSNKISQLRSNNGTYIHINDITLEDGEICTTRNVTPQICDISIPCFISEEEKEAIKNHINSRKEIEKPSYSYELENETRVITSSQQDEHLTKIAVNNILKELKLKGKDPENLIFDFKGFQISDNLKLKAKEIHFENCIFQSSQSLTCDKLFIKECSMLKDDGKIDFDVTANEFHIKDFEKHQQSDQENINVNIKGSIDTLCVDKEFNNAIYTYNNQLRVNISQLSPHKDKHYFTIKLIQN